MGNPHPPFEISDGTLRPTMDKCQVHRGVAWEFAGIGRRPIRGPAKPAAINHVAADATGAEAIRQAPCERVALIMVEVDEVIGDVRQRVGGKERLAGHDVLALRPADRNIEVSTPWST